MPVEGEILKERYKILAILGEGGMGTVYRALDLETGLKVAVKRLFVPDFIPADENTHRHDETAAHQSLTLPRRKVVEQFQVEINLLKTLQHEQVPHLLDSFSFNDLDYYYVMSLVEGRNLAEVVEENQGPLPEATVRNWLGQILSILKYCHSMGVIHRDVKPENLLLAEDGRIYLVDFGIAKDLGSRESTTTTIGARAFTPYYSPPEQRPGGSGTDERTDIYALGAVTYHLVTGKPPLDSQQLVEQKTLVRPASLNPQISPGLENFILRCIRTEKAERPQSIADAENLLNAPLDAASLEDERQFEQDHLLQTVMKSSLPSPLPEVKAIPLKPDQFRSSNPLPEMRATPAGTPPAPAEQTPRNPPPPAPLPELRAQPAAKPPSPAVPPPQPAAPGPPAPVVPNFPINFRPAAGAGSRTPLRLVPSRRYQPSSPKKAKVNRKWLVIAVMVLLVLIGIGIALAIGLSGSGKSPRAALRQAEAQNDDYSAVGSFPLVVDTLHGLLANDRGVDMSLLSVGLSSSTKYGLLKLNSDGSFTYIPEAGFTGRDTFTYQFVAYKSPGEPLVSKSFSVIIDVAPPYRLWLPVVGK